MWVLKVEVAHVQALCSSVWPWRPCHHPCRQAIPGCCLDIYAESHVGLPRNASYPSGTELSLFSEQVPLLWRSAVALCPLPCIPHHLAKFSASSKDQHRYQRCWKALLTFPSLLLGVLGASAGVGGWSLCHCPALCVRVGGSPRGLP